ncbi:hypothetical protein C8J56DRAFT_1062073 [Mycena floridula]|nr:hypothetical protein C8J56DRAFT_1062073 [Mycena floridula]
MTARVDGCDACDAKFTLLPQLRSFNLLPRLRTNEILPSSIDNQLSQLLAAAESESALYDGELVRLHSRIIAIENAKREFEKEVIRCKSSRSPIRKLPLELITAVLKECATGATVGQSLTVSSAPALRLARVCTHWRHIALSTGALWSTIAIDVSASGENQLRAIRELMQRAGNSMLDIRLFDSWKDEEEYTIERHDAVDILMVESNRWRTLEINLPLDFTAELLSPIRDNLLNLESLEVTFSLPHGDPVDFFKTAPKLRSISISNHYPADFDIPWTQIQYYHYDGSSATDFLKNLSLCENVTSLNIAGIEGQIYRPAFITAPLHMLSIDMGSKRQQSLVNCLLLQLMPNPGLSSFRLSTVSRFTQHSMSNLSQFVGRQSETLTSLELVEVWVDPAVLHQILQCTPALTFLLVLEVPKAQRDSAMITSKIVNAMSNQTLQLHGSSPRVLLPRLEHLKLELHGGAGYVSEQTLVDMIKSRWRPPSTVGESSSEADEAACLRTVSLTTHRPFPKRLLQTLEYLRLSGMAIEVMEAKETATGTKK